ncbi:hypothetical protein [Shimia sediminis]|uniref:hypothetical protein n=1 Tax=Shimia sediminis TaxID=2497945 RepID=UPI000F8EA7BB|nr:hypothetical protein [Shimia sediminis]
MVTNNKVLTVSYGTFSCTLEGFDDSFDTMKAIAEYFRDLAADDRYFGAEPPTPDAEMLARIAEREIERRVQARTEHGAIVLSAGDATPENAPVQEDAQPEVAEEAQPAPLEQDALEEDAEEVSEEAPEVDAEPEVVDVTASVLQAVATDEEAIDEAEEPHVEEESHVEETTEADSDDETEIVALTEVEATEDTPSEQVDDEIEDAEIMETEVVEVAEEEDASPDEDSPDDTMIADILEASEEDAAEDNESAEAEFVEPEPAQEPPADSIAAKLQRIRAVVSKSRAEPDADDFSEDEHAEPLLAEAPKDVEPVLTLDGDMAAAAAAMDAEVSEEDVQEEAAETTAIQPVRARVIRMKKTDLEAAVDTGLLEAEVIEDDGEDARTSSLSAEEEADLLAELAQVEAELNGDMDDDEPVEAIGADMDSDLDDVPQRSERGRHLIDASGQSDSDVARLLQETDSQMEEPDGSRRRQAIAHLRAAVAATKAEQKAAKESDKPKDVTEAYRDDLASVMRPSASDAPKKASAQPPLKLVAEQRVDDAEEAQAEEMPEETPRAPVRPRRVSAADRNERAEAAPVGQDIGSFAEFAETVGAHDLTEILEAAAAYLTFVEKLDVFSRPMIVRMAQGMGDGDFSREDSLRGFGQLLRENKITKVSGGRFTASDEISFRPQDRAFG